MAMARQLRHAQRRLSDSAGNPAQISKTKEIRYVRSIRQPA